MNKNSKSIRLDSFRERFNVWNAVTRDRKVNAGLRPFLSVRLTFLTNSRWLMRRSRASDVVYVGYRKTGSSGLGSKSNNVRRTWHSSSRFTLSRSWICVISVARWVVDPERATAEEKWVQNRTSKWKPTREFFLHRPKTDDGLAARMCQSSPETVLQDASWAVISSLPCSANISLSDLFTSDMWHSHKTRQALKRNKPKKKMKESIQTNWTDKVVSGWRWSVCFCLEDDCLFHVRTRIVFHFLFT